MCTENSSELGRRDRVKLLFFTLNSCVRNVGGPEDRRKHAGDDGAGRAGWGGRVRPAQPGLGLVLRGTRSWGLRWQHNRLPRGRALTFIFCGFFIVCKKHA